MTEGLEYLGVKKPLRVSHAVEFLVEPEQIGAHLEEHGLSDEFRSRIRAQIENRKKVMAGLHKEVEMLEEKLEQYPSQDAVGDTEST